MTTPLDALLGHGLLRPFRRDLKNDFAHTGGIANVAACVGQILGTLGSTDDGGVSGELPWRPEFGTVMSRLRHRNNDFTLQALARTYVVDALTRWEPRVVVREVTCTTRKVVPGQGGDDGFFVKVVYDVIRANVPGNQVIVPNITQEVRVA